MSYSSLESFTCVRFARLTLMAGDFSDLSSLKLGLVAFVTSHSAVRKTLPSTTLNNTVKSQIPDAMTCMELAHNIEKFQPSASPQEVARLCLLLTTSVDDLTPLRDQRALRDAWKRTGLKLQVATDQHAAMTEELEELAASDPQSFSQEQIWVLIRAIKVQSQVLQMYVGHPLIDV
jgi:hypothetical protein